MPHSPDSSEMGALNKPPHRLGLVLLWCAVPLLLLASLMSGPTPLPLGSALADVVSGEASIDAVILVELRLPRALLAALVGAMLGLSGAALQGLLRNPLASPDILGISQTAALCAVVVLYFGFAQLAWFVLPLAAIAGAATAALLMLALTWRYGGVHTIILAGIAISALASALTALALNFAPNPYALQEIYYWLLGSVSNRSLPELALALPFMLLGTVLLLRSGAFLDALGIGEAGARSLGFEVTRQSRVLVAGVACCTGAAVALSGSIAFVGLMVPHLLRPLVAARPGPLLLASIPGGACAVLLADLLLQQLPGQQQLQLGVLTAALGGPFFLFLLLRRKAYFA